MPSPTITLRVRGNTRTSLNQAQVAVDAALVNSLIRNIPRNWVESESLDVDGSLERILEVKFTTKAEGDRMWAVYQGLVGGLRTRVVGSMSYHQCSHEDPVVVDCKVHPDSEYVEVRI